MSIGKTNVFWTRFPKCANYLFSCSFCILKYTSRKRLFSQCFEGIQITVRVLGVVFFLGRPEMHDHEDDNPALLDGIIGIENPPDNIPVISPTNIVGALSDNEGLPMMYTGSFKLKFEGADASLETHEAYIPVDDGNWHVEMILLEGYEVKSCEDCEDLVIEGSNAKFNADEPVTVIFGKVDTSDCNAIVTIGDDGYSFEPADITIAAGDTVCWIWKGTSDVHNVAEVATKFDADMNLG